MEREEFKILAKSMKAVYAQPTFLPDQDAFNVWYALLKDLPYELASMAIQKHMMTEKFPPTIADIRSKAFEMMEKPVEEMSELEAWAIVRKAIGRSGYYSEEEFEKLPEACRIAVGSPANLREWALMDSDEVATVEQSHFIRNYRAAVKRMAEDKKLPPAFRERIAESRQKYTALNSRDRQEIEKKSEEEEPKKEERHSEMSEEIRRKLDELLRGIRT
ncbi:MAG: replicative helicase loader/inhibitor [Eubacteriales bacterium]|nr:replicative helicase loader/inhibitor [Eubacteriales bacterium]